MGAPKVLTLTGTIGIVVAIVMFAFAPLAVDQINGDLRPLVDELLPGQPLVP